MSINKQVLSALVKMWICLIWSYVYGTASRQLDEEHSFLSVEIIASKIVEMPKK